MVKFHHPADLFDLSHSYGTSFVSIWNVSHITALENNHLERIVVIDINNRHFNSLITLFGLEIYDAIFDYWMAKRDRLI